MKCKLFFLILLFGVYRTTWAKKHYVVTPSTFRLNSDETIAVAVEGKSKVFAHVLIQDHPGKIKNISFTPMILLPGEPRLFKVRLESSSFPEKFLTAPGSQKFVSLNFISENFKKEIIVPISIQSGYVFIQTDKPIYRPTQHAQFRVISLNEDELPSDDTYKLQIKNPKGITVLEKLFNPKTQKVKKLFDTYIYKFPVYAMLGEWSASVLYGYKFQQNSTVKFELREYVLPTFTVELETKEVILPSTEVISAKVTAMHVYGKAVNGIVTFKVGVKRGDSEPKLFGIFGPRNLNAGSYDLRIRTEDMKNHNETGWFPKIKDSYLVIEATVVDSATGNKETATDAKGRFCTTPFMISFERCLVDFKPGLVSVFEANIYHHGGKPASGIPAFIHATADGEPINIVKNTSISDEDGKVSFEIHPELKHSVISITIETNDPRYNGSQAKGRFLQRKYESDQKAYIALSRSTPHRLSPGDMFSKVVHFQPTAMPDTYYLVVSKGKIISMNKLPHGEFKAQRVEIPVTYDMVPSFRVIVYAYYNKELLADSLKVDVERVCDPNAVVSLHPDYPDSEPGNIGKITIRGTSGTLVGLLGVDEAVYAISKKGLLTKDNIFNTIGGHDLGCGPGGGLNVDAVFGNAGIILGTNDFTSSLEHSCGEVRRIKREAAVNKVRTYTGLERECCALGIEHDLYNRNCEDRAVVVEDTLNGQYPNCTEAFKDCCLHAEENDLTELKLKNKLSLGRTYGDGIDEIDFDAIIDEKKFEKEATARTDFRETWIFDDVYIGSDKKAEYRASLPHSITTWVIQAVSVSPTYGICVVEPQKLVSFKKIFVHLNLPYSVVQNEQVDIQATLFNYGQRSITAYVYLHGAKDLCAGAVAGEKSERKTIYLEAQSAKIVSFPVVPLKAEDIPIRIVAFTTEGTDIIEKKLHVIPEGIPREINIPIQLDPSNQQNRKKRSIQNEIYSDSIDPQQNYQVTAVKLKLPEGFVPGTASCFITAIGHYFGTMVGTAVNNPDCLLVQPTGCGEQNMIRLAPTLYAMRYMKVTGEITSDVEEKGYAFMREGYDNQLAYTKDDGSYAIYKSRPSSTWLTAFVMKVFCQATELIYIDENVICRGIRWLVRHQEPDGSYIDYNPVYEKTMLGGIEGKVPMTAFTLIALHECKCKDENLEVVKARAVSYLEDNLGNTDTPLSNAITAYALALSDSSLKYAANDKLISSATYDEDANMLHWETENSARDIETAGYALLTQLVLNDMEKSCSIVNWLNSKQKASGFVSTQDTVVALQALSEYAIRVQMPSLNLVSNISSSNDRNFREVLVFNDQNAYVQQDVKIKKLGGTLFINTAGHGVGSLAVNLRYNIIVPYDQTCKFDIQINVTKAKEELPLDLINASRKTKNGHPDDILRDIVYALRNDVPAENINPRNRGKREALESSELMESKNVVSRMRRQDSAQNNKMKLKISICLRHLGNRDAERSIVDIEIFSGFVPVMEDLRKIVENGDEFIENYEKSVRGLVIYFEKIPKDVNYCFSFHVIREYIVGNTRNSIVKVYEYYNPDEACTKYYSPESNSPIIRTICEGHTCECLEGGCPPKIPFANTADLSQSEKRAMLKEMLCDDYDYVWNGTLFGDIKKGGGYLNITFTINEVIKRGIEKIRDIAGDTRTLLARDNCEIANLDPRATYLIMGKDGEKFQNDNGEIWHRYILDKTSTIYKSTSVRLSPNKELQRALNYVTNVLAEDGCEK